MILCSMLPDRKILCRNVSSLVSGFHRGKPVLRERPCFFTGNSFRSGNECLLTLRGEFFSAFPDEFLSAQNCGL